MDMSQINKHIYDEIYHNADDVPGYDRYFLFYKNIKNHSNPLKWLSAMEDTYLSVYEFLEGKKWLNCLEIWTWLWYLTYAINQTWNTCLGVDISKESISKAKSNFWDFYLCEDITSNHTSLDGKKYDLIIATELIEHLNDFDLFFDKCFQYLKKWWSLIITTPNKDLQKHALWFWDLPPVHTILFSKKTFKYIANKWNMNLKFSSACDRWNINNLVVNLYYLLFPWKWSTPIKFLPSLKSTKNITYKSKIFNFLNRKSIRYISNIISWIIFWKWNWMVLHCIFQKF